MNYIYFFIDFIMHLDIHLADIVRQYGVWTYLILFTIIFCETGLVVTPFLPGDSLLFVVGALSASGMLNIELIIVILILAAVLGDTVNYHIGKFFGDALYSKDLRFIKKDHLIKTHNFYEKHGGKTIILARFIPIIRTFAPLVAGMGKMSYFKFLSYNIIGGISWILLFSLGGFFFGNIPSVKKNFTLVIFAIIIISVFPGVITYLKNKKNPN